MKLRFFLILCLFMVLTTNAQVGIGTVNPSAILDIPSTVPGNPSNSDGILIPRIDVFPATPPTNAQHAMLVFLTTASGSNQPGFYYWDKITAAWIGLGTLKNNWSLTGNTATVPGTNFLGTTDDKDIVFKRNNARSAFIGDPVYDASFNYNNGNTSFGANSLVNPSINIGTQLGVRNTAIGTNVMPSLGQGKRNVGVGDAALFSVTSGAENTAVGVGALYSVSTTGANVAVGRNALTNSTASNNTAVGFASLRQNVSGTNNTALGYESLRSNLGSGNVGLGYQAGYAETGSNRLYIHNTNADAVNSLVYGEFDNKIFRTNAQLQINDPLTTGYKFPTARGTNKQVLETDGSGNLSWTNGINSVSVVRSTMSGDQALGSGGWQKVNFAFVIFDTNGEFNTGSNRFVATKAGYYEINAGYHVRTITSSNLFSIGVRVNGGFYQETGSNHVSGVVSRTINCIVNLAAGDYIEIFAENTTSGAVIDGYSGKTYFEVHQIK